MSNKVRLFAFLFLAMMASAVSAQDITTLDWDEMHIDTVLPVYSEMVPLETDYRRYDYAVTVEYPEWGSLTVAENQAIKPFADQISEELKIESHVGVSRRVGELDIAFVPIICKDGHYRKLLSCKIVITPTPKKQMLRATSNEADRYTRTSVLSEGKWVKISITEDGIYRLTSSALKKMGFSNPDNVHLYGYGGHRLSEVMSSGEFYDDMEEVPLYKADASTWLFWGNGLVHWSGDQRVFNPYATEACYFLTEDSVNTGIQSIESLTEAPKQVYTTFTAHALYEKDEYAWYAGGRNLFENTNYATSNAHTYKFSNIEALDDAKLTVAFTASASSTTAVSVMVNGTTMSKPMNLSAIQTYIKATEAIQTYDVSSLSVGSDWTIKLTSTSGHDARLDYLSMAYKRNIALTADDPGFVAFTQTGSGISQFNISGTGLKVMRLGLPSDPAVLVNGKQSGDTLSLIVGDATRQYVAFDPSYAFPQPTVVGSVENQNLHALDSLDMVILIPESGKLRAQAERLAEAHRQYDALHVAVLSADQVYNEFSSGTPDATAYRRLMKMLYDRASASYRSDLCDYLHSPRYLLLMGDCSWDNRMVSTAWRNYDPKDYLLCFESENSFSDTKSYVMEDYFGLLDDGEGASLTQDKVDLGVGRFPVTTEAEAKIMVDKCIAYMSNSNAGNWKNIITMLGDDGDENEHMIYADDVAERVISANPEMEVRKVMWDAYTRVSTISSNTYPEVTSLIKQQMNDGALVMNYTGHGATYCLSHEMVLKLEDFRGYKSKNLPLWVTAACDVMPFDGQTENIGETAVLNEGGAALAFWGTARTVYAYNNLQLNRYFMKYLLARDADGRRYRLGDAIRLAKSTLTESSNSENKLQYALLGDPALTIGAPTNRVVLDSINGVSTANVIQLKAGERIRMSGHIADSEGSTLNSFRGTLSTRVYDSAEKVTCLNNAGASEAFSFTNREKVLYDGQDSVQSGCFSFEFVMPVDINNSKDAGRVVFYAITDSLETEANGYSEDFYISGTSSTIDADTIGPKIYAYLNTEDFENGDKVNSTPYFIAHLSDDSGISYSGNGLGHDLLLTIDNNPSTTYVLNEYYAGEFGDFTSGTVGYSIPSLSDGRHSLSFRAWDVLNNTSTVNLDFEVDSSLKPSLLELTASQSPATTSTNFLLTYDRAGSECDFTIEVFDFAGRRMWCHTETGASDTGMYSIPWNLCMQGGGRVCPGIYLYRATLVSGNSKEVTKTQKIIVNGNNRP